LLEGLILKPFAQSDKPFLTIDQDFKHALYCRLETEPSSHHL
jgi:hypothetical protein